MKSLFLILFSALAIGQTASASIGEFRCIGEYKEQDRLAYMIFSGAFQESKMTAMKFEFIAENGFYSAINNPVVQNFSYEKNVFFGFQFLIDGNFFVVTTKYNRATGGYIGEFSKKSLRGEVHTPIRCMVLRAI